MKGYLKAFAFVFVLFLGVPYGLMAVVALGTYLTARPSPPKPVAAMAPSTETVSVRYGGMVPIYLFMCERLDSSFLSRACYDIGEDYLIIEIDRAWYQYCGVDYETFARLTKAESPGRFYNEQIKSGENWDSPFDCRVHPAPDYSDFKGEDHE